MIDFKQPDFLFCEIPIKDGTYNDNRIWVFHRRSLSLIEFVEVSNFKDFKFTGFQKRYENEIMPGVYEDYFGIYSINNCEQTDYNQEKVLDAAWKYLKDYFDWEDTNMDNE